MTLAAVISTLLARVRAEHYAGRIREYMRDERAITQAIARYGYECHARGWELEESDIWGAVHQVLDTMRGRRHLIDYLPVYLEGAIDRHIRLRAEEIQTRSREIAPRLRRVVDRTASAVVVQQTPVEALSHLYRDLKSHRRHRQPTGTKPAKQLSLI